MERKVKNESDFCFALPAECDNTEILKINY